MTPHIIITDPDDPAREQVLLASATTEPPQQPARIDWRALFAGMGPEL